MAPDDQITASTAEQFAGRREDDRFLTGSGCFLDDLAVENLAHSVVLRSPHAHAEITKIDTAAAAERLTRRLQTKVEIKRKGRSGTVCVAFHNEEELMRLYDLFMQAGGGS